MYSHMHMCQQFQHLCERYAFVTLMTQKLERKQLWVEIEVNREKVLLRR
jgi:hypothetical protein